MADEKIDFKGVVVRRDPDGYGEVELEDADSTLAFFTGEVIHDPWVNRNCVKGRRVHGRAIRYGEGYRIVRLEPESSR